MEVVVLDPFIHWYEALPDRLAFAVNRYVDLLTMMGTSLGYPYSSAIHGASFALRELRIKTSSSAIRVFYAYDSSRNAVLIIGGDKTGAKRFYEEKVQECEKIWREYLEEVGDGKL